MRHNLAQGTSLPASIDSGISLRNSLVPNSTTLYKIKLPECYGVFATVIPVESLSVSHAYDEGDLGSILASLLLATRQSIWAPLVTQSGLFRLLSWQHNYPQAFPVVTSYPHSLAPISTLPSPCDWHHPRHQSPLPQGPQSTYKTTFCTSCSSLTLDFLNCETICYLMCFVRRGCAFCFVVVLSWSFWSCYFNSNFLLPLNGNCSLFTGHLCLITGGGYSWTLMSN